jgi:hypothetical protein
MDPWVRLQIIATIERNQRNVARCRELGASENELATWLDEIRQLDRLLLEPSAREESA